MIVSEVIVHLPASSASGVWDDNGISQTHGIAICSAAFLVEFIRLDQHRMAHFEEGPSDTCIVRSAHGLVPSAQS